MNPIGPLSETHGLSIGKEQFPTKRQKKIFVHLLLVQLPPNLLFLTGIINYLEGVRDIESA